MCHVCERLGIVIDYPPPKTDEEMEKEAAEEAAREEAEAQKREQARLELIAQGKPIPKAPRKRLGSGSPTPPTKVIVELAPSHDGTPTFAAYEAPVPLLGPDDSPPSENPEKHRPPFGIRFYDITPTATPERAALLARRISELTHDVRYNDRCYDKDRIEVVAMPLLDQSMTTDDQAARCIAHNEAERAARLTIADATVAASWYIVECFRGWNCSKDLFIISDLKEDSWEDALRNPDKVYWTERSDHGHFRHVSYEKRFDDPEDDEEDRRREFFPSVEFPLERVGNSLAEVRCDAGYFYLCHFIPEGVLDMELALARADAAGVEVPRPVVIPFRPDAHR